MLLLGIASPGAPCALCVSGRGDAREGGDEPTPGRQAWPRRTSSRLPGPASPADVNAAQHCEGPPHPGTSEFRRPCPRLSGARRAVQDVAEGGLQLGEAEGVAARLGGRRLHPQAGEQQLVAAAGCTRRLASSSSSASSPSSSRRPSSGAVRKPGRPSTPARVAAYSALVTGLGAVPLTGPSRSPLSSAWRYRPTVSSRAIQLHHCRPDPSRPPRPSRNSGSCLATTGASAAWTMPLRMCTTRRPAARAGSAAASHCRTTSARNPPPAGLDSVSTSSPRSPYQWTPEAQTSTRGPPAPATPAIVSASSRVPLTRLCRISSLILRVQRMPSPMPLPARCTTASALASASASIRPAIGSQRLWLGLVGRERVSRST